MTTYFPGSHELAQRLEKHPDTLVLCFCAAWCDTCKQYQPKFEELSAKHAEASFVWIDIEEHSELLGDEDVENFPTIAILHGEEVRFMGTILPHIEHLDRLIEAMRAPGKPQETELPEDLLGLLTKSA
jgi:thioredoxin 1